MKITSKNLEQQKKSETLERQQVRAVITELPKIGKSLETLSRSIADFIEKNDADSENMEKMSRDMLNLHLQAAETLEVIKNSSLTSNIQQTLDSIANMLDTISSLQLTLMSSEVTVDIDYAERKGGLERMKGFTFKRNLNQTKDIN